MKITSSSQPYVRPGSLPSSPERNVGHYVPGYTGPKDGLSQQKHQWLTQPLNKALIAGCFRMEVENPENMPPEGAHVYCPTHPSMFDPPLVMALTKRDIRSVANVYVFDGVRGHVMSWGGAFPVNRENATVQSVRHCVDVLKQGKGLCIFPEGRVDEAHAEGKIGQLKRGPAWAALEANAESLIPINVNYEKNTKARPGETAFGVGAALAVAAGGALAAMFGGPAVQVAAGAVTGALAGMYAGGKRAHDRTENPEYFDQFPKYFATLKGGALGAIAGAVGGGALAHAGALAGTLTGVAGAVGTYGLVRGWRDRDIARVTIGVPLKVADYVEKYPFSNRIERATAVNALTEDLHRSLGQTKALISGVPYDDPAEKIRYKITETLKAPSNP